MSEPDQYIFEEWDSMCARANKNLHGDCPLAEDEVLVEMHKHVHDLRAKVAELEAGSEPFLYYLDQGDGNYATSKIRQHVSPLHWKPLYTTPQPVKVESIAGLIELELINNSSSDAGVICDAAAKRIAAMLYATPQPVTVPEGYALVPVEPTDGMVDAFYNYFNVAYPGEEMDNIIASAWFPGAYKAMLSAQDN